MRPTGVSLPERPPFRAQLVYAFGQMGWSLASFGTANLLVYFYLPPEEAGQQVFPTFIFQGSVLGLATIIGLVSFGGRILDAVTDPLIAAWSDRMESKRGKRTRMMGWAALPFSALSFLVFFPPGAGPGAWNALWLLVTVVLFYLAMTLYVIPCTALIGELGHHRDDRMRLSTLVSVAWALGFLAGSNIYALQDLLEPAIGAVGAFQLALGGFSLLSFFFMMVPVWWLDEKRFALQQSVLIPVPEAMRSVYGNRNYRLFIFSDLFYWLALTFIQLGVSFFVTLLFGLEKTWASFFLLISFGSSFFYYFPVNRMVARFGKRRVYISGFLVFLLVFLLTATAGWSGFPLRPLFWLLALAGGYPLAVFGILPSALIADIVEDHFRDIGLAQSGMFYAMRNLMMKLGISLANLLFPSVLLLGRTASADLGVRVAAFLAAGFCALGFVLFLGFREKTKPDEAT